MGELSLRETGPARPAASVATAPGATGLAAAPAGCRIVVTGVVQGVGFRPFVYRLARAEQLRGWVRNVDDRVEMEVWGVAEAITRFCRRLQEEAPPLSRVERIKVTWLGPETLPAGGMGDVAGVGGREFVILPSAAAGEQPGWAISPDVAVCFQCRRELFDPRDRRYLYPFINCTDCGPRYTIMEGLPYDRSRTSMRSFRLCDDCAREYDDPGDRRFHAQPIACPACGPSASLVGVAGVAGDSDGRAGKAEILARLRPQSIPAERELFWQRVRRELGSGKILAVKGLGGFHLACDAHQPAAVRRLRERKRRPHKPLAVMMRDLATVQKYCEVSEEERETLLSPAAPIVLLRPRQQAVRTAGWAQAGSGGLAWPELIPGLNRIGVMLPYTPLHLLLFDDNLDVLVMTSGNESGFPLAASCGRAWRELRGIADLFLFHNRPILRRLDDSVVIVKPGGCGSRHGRHEGGINGGHVGGHVGGHDGGHGGGLGGGHGGRLGGGHDVGDDGGYDTGHDSDGDHGKPGDRRGRLQVWRRARGFVPEPVASLPRAAPGLGQSSAGGQGAVRGPGGAVLALGAEQNAAFALLDPDTGRLYPGPHIGDLGTAELDAYMCEQLASFCELLGVRPAGVVVDPHPAYRSRRLGEQWAAERGLKIQYVQHHEAHVAAVMVEEGWTGECLGLACDGTGWGSDGRVWGCELFAVDTLAAPFRRLAHLQYLPLPGGETAIRKPWWLAVAYTAVLTPDLWAWLEAYWPARGREMRVIRRLAELLAEGVPQQPAPQHMGRAAQTPASRRRAVPGLPVVATSSLGRLFDAVAGLLGIVDEASYEGQAAMELEALAETAGYREVPGGGGATATPAATEAATEAVTATPAATAAGGGLAQAGSSATELEVASLWRELITELQQGQPVAGVACRFQKRVVEMLAGAVVRAAAVTGYKRVVLGGGCFHNLYLSRWLRHLLEQGGLVVAEAQQVSPGDGGLAVGQVALAVARGEWRSASPDYPAPQW